MDRPMPSSTRLLTLLYTLACLIGLLGLGVLWHGLGRPVHLPDAANATHKLQCASYTPFDKDQSPYDQPMQLRPARMDADLALLAERFQCIRTYSMSGLEAIPALARKHGLKVMLGAWVNAHPADTDREVALLIAAANANPDVVSAVIVGNETLLRKEVTGKRLAELIARVKRQVSVPVTYADVWEFWLQHPEIAPEVDFLTIHLLPYWEDEPRGIDDALAHVADIRRQFGQRFAPKDILIGETGWPSEGRQRETALPSRVNEARFIRGFVAMAEHNGWRYNLIEAFDQPWKRANEGAVGGYWGLYDADRQDKGILEGPVSNLPDWPTWWLACAALAGLMLCMAGRPRTRRGAWAMPILAMFGAACLGLWGELMRSHARFAPEWMWAGLLAGLNVLVLARALLHLSQPQGVRGRWSAWLQRRAGGLLLLAGFAAAVSTLAMVFDPRYRSFPSAALALPALVFVLWPVPVRRREATFLASIIGLGILPQLLIEGMNSGQAWRWAAVSALMTAALWRSQRLGHA
ncbi:beta (1-6) glucans synthase [Pseudomonas fulva]|uniref:glycoside hydrolase family 17 protein n=1 Tax=Pseudomonas TaxID=286 RepID=UPI0011A9165D|nr:MULTISPECIES: beta (1-6) glucans synthase [Pseudomonas]MDH1308853.1 beta (1-6) glucans synthase [Pseudomonas fulva]